jgi:hypothetical protein
MVTTIFNQIWIVGEAHNTQLLNKANARNVEKTKRCLAEYPKDTK